MQKAFPCYCLIMGRFRTGQAPVPLRIFRSNSKFDENSKHSSVKYTWPITTIFCTRHDSVTVVTCAKYRCDRSSIFETRAFWTTSTCHYVVMVHNHIMTCWRSSDVWGSEIVTDSKFGIHGEDILLLITLIVCTRPDVNKYHHHSVIMFVPCKKFPGRVDAQLVVDANLARAPAVGTANCQ